MHGGHPVYIGTRNHAKETAAPEFVLQLSEGWGATTKVQQTPYMFLSGHANFYHTIVVYAHDAGSARALRDLRERLARLRERSANVASMSRAAVLKLFASIRARVVETEAAERLALTELSRIVQ